MKRLLVVSILLASCGPVETKTYVSPAMQQVGLAQQAQTAAIEKAKFVYQEKTHDCRNGFGVQGYNETDLGPCSLIMNDSQVTKILSLSAKDSHDFRGSMFYQLALPTNANFQNLNLDDTVWIKVKGVEVKFDNSSKNNAQFIQCEMD